MSFGLKVITGLQFSPWNFWKLQNRPYPLLPLPALLPVAGHRQRRRGAPSRLSRPLLRRALAPTRRGRAPPPPVASRWSPHPSPRRPAESRSARAAATSPSRWRARCSGRRPLLASARALQIPQKPIPTALLLSPRSHTAEHHRRPAGTPASSPRRGAATPEPLHPNSPHH